ncbi:MAG: aldo/keto reductase [Bacteroidales bacterium]|nr:aldo/keto reductase [Bacteroidales bacterium]
MLLNNGISMPAMGYGTFNVPEETVASLVAAALQCGCHHIDSATRYENEKGTGQGLRDSGVPRKDFFLTSKVWNTSRGYDNTMRAFEQSLSDLGTDYLDLYLIHWPANRKQFGDRADAINRDTWRALETLYKEGRVRAIGLSNFLQHHIEPLMETAEIQPMVDQVELHPGFAREDLCAWCKERNIVMQAWSQLGRGRCLGHPAIVEMASRYDVSPAQLILRWVMQLGIVPLFKASSPERIRENFLPATPEEAVAGRPKWFELSAEDVRTLIDLPIGPLSRQPDDVDF